MFHEALLVPKEYLRDRYSYDRQAYVEERLELDRADPRFYEVTFEDANKIVDAFNAQAREGTLCAFTVEHALIKNGITPSNRVILGGITRAWMDPQQGLMAEILLDKDKGGAALAALQMKKGWTSEVSLNHDARTGRPLDVSLCVAGARKGTFIRPLQPKSKSNSNSNSGAYNNPSDASSSSLLPIAASKSVTFDSLSSSTSTLTHQRMSQPPKPSKPQAQAQSQAMETETENAPAAASGAAASGSGNSKRSAGRVRLTHKDIPMIMAKLMRKEQLNEEEVEFLASNYVHMLEAHQQSEEEGAKRESKIQQEYAYLAETLKAMGKQLADRKMLPAAVASSMEGLDSQQLQDRESVPSVLAPLMVAASAALNHNDTLAQIQTPPDPLAGVDPKQRQLLASLQELTAKTSFSQPPSSSFFNQGAHTLSGGGVPTYNIPPYGSYSYPGAAGGAAAPNGGAQAMRWIQVPASAAGSNYDAHQSAAYNLTGQGGYMPRSEAEKEKEILCRYLGDEFGNEAAYNMRENPTAIMQFSKERDRLRQIADGMNAKTSSSGRGSSNSSSSSSNTESRLEEQGSAKRFRATT